MIWSKHEIELEKMIQLLTDERTWGVLNEMDLGKVAALKLLRDMRDSIAGIESDIQTAILGLKLLERLPEIRQMIDIKTTQLGG